MTAGMIGAQLEELDLLASRLGTTTTDIADVENQTRTTADTVVDAMTAAFGEAMTAISGAMTQLQGTVETTQGQLADTAWTGANKDRFDAGYGDFNAAMTTFKSDIETGYTDFNAQMELVSGVIRDFQVQVSASMQQAQDSTTSMEQAVRAQRENLDTAMNSGLSFA